MQSGKEIFTTNDLALLWDISNRQTLIRTIWRYVDKKTLFRISKGLYSTMPIEKLDKYKLGCAVGGAFSYISGETILEKNGILMQETKKITLFGKKEKTITIANTTFLCRYLNTKFLLNRTSIEDYNGYALATVERAVADLRYINPRFFVDNELSFAKTKVDKLSKDIGYYDSTK